MNTSPEIDKTSEEDPLPDFIPAAAVPYILSFIRYTGGAIATCAATIPGIFLAVRLPHSSGEILIRGPQTFLCTLTIIGIGFFSVLIGTFITPKSVRHISSWAYSMVGAFWYIWIWSETVYEFITRADRTQSLPPFLPLLPWALLGGFSCSLLFTLFRKKPLRSDDATANANQKFGSIADSAA
jgi:hypothetical protein